MEPIYLDNNATTPADPAVIRAMSEVMAQVGANPASPHRAGREARRRLDDAADEILRLLGGQTDHAAGDRLVLTSGGTEANNLALRGLPYSLPGRVLVSSIEHPSTLQAARCLQQAGWQVDWIQALESGTLDLDHLHWLLEAPGPPVRLVSMMLGNNETGVLQPVAEVVRLCEPRGIAVHTDAVQAVGKIPVDFGQLGVSLMTVAAHKFHGPCGNGALLVKGRTELNPLLVGGGQQLGTRPGTEPVALAVGMLTALQLWRQEVDLRPARLAACRDELQRRLTADAAVVVNGTAPRLPHTLNVSFTGVDRQALLMALDLAGIYCSSGSACASGSSEPSHVLQAMGLDADRVDSALRLSVGVQTRVDQMPLAATRILKAFQQLRGQISG